MVLVVQLMFVGVNMRIYLCHFQEIGETQEAVLSQLDKALPNEI